MPKIDLKEVAKSKGYTLTDIKNNTGISMNTLSLLGRNESKGIQFETLEKICNFLGVTPNDIIKIGDDQYTVLVDQQQKDKDWIYIHAVKTSILEESRKKNTMYNADENEIKLTVYCLSNSYKFIQFFVGLPMPSDMFTINMKNNSKFIKNYDFEKAKKQIKNLTDGQKESIGKQAATIYIKNYWDKKLPQQVFIGFNEETTINGTRIYQYTFSEKDMKLHRYYPNNH